MQINKQRNGSAFALGSLAAAILACAAFWPVQSQAALFGDDEARKAIIELRNKVDTQQQAQQALNKELRDANEELRESGATSRRSLLDLANQIEQLRAEIARLRGQNEQLTRDVSELQRQQKDVQAGINERLKAVEPLKVTLDGVEFQATPAEKKDFEGAMEVLRRSEFEAAAQSFVSFLRRNPDSGYTPTALYWLGNAQYASRAYLDAIESHKRLVTRFPNHVRAPEALLAMANSQVEVKDSKAARRTLEDLVKLHPQSEAAAAARERLARLR